MAEYPKVTEAEYEPEAIEGLFVLRPKTVEDERGTVREFFRRSTWLSSPMPTLPAWSQVNLTFTAYGAVRAFHAEGMTKLVGVAAGEAFGAYVDLRLEPQPTFRGLHPDRG